MKKVILILTLSFISAMMAFAFFHHPGQEATTGNLILYNQVGYITHGPKMLLVAEEVDLVVIRDASGGEVFRATPDSAMFWARSGDAVRKVDFSELSVPGNYSVLLPGQDHEAGILISDRPFKEVSKAALRAFYYNRSGMAIDPAHGGQWARPAGHPDTVVYVHASAATEARPEGTIISSPGGWYDAGDYNKYIVNSGITTYTMFRALQDYKDYHVQLNVNIPESGSGVPDLLSEALYNFRWMLTMWDPNDGGVYHKLTNKQFDGIVMPHEALEDRYVVMKTTAAALNFAAVAAKAYRVLREYESYFPGLAEESIQKAEWAWNWAMRNPDVLYRQPEDIHTGTYGDRNLEDEFFWAACELFLSTRKYRYLEVVLEKYTAPPIPTWNQVYALGFMSLLDQYNRLPEILRHKGLHYDFIKLVEYLVDVSETAPYGVSIQSFAWGSNSTVANHGMLKLVAYKHTGNEKYLRSAISDLDYIMGRNATGYCFVTGFGHQKVMNIHHRPSEADDIEDPVPGFLAGGPNLATFQDCPPEVQRSQHPAKSYVDHWCSYSTNEIAINWNAPLVYLLSGIETILSGQ